MTTHSNRSVFSVFFTMILGWIALAGLADNLVTWKDWFEYGFMEHWRNLKAFLGLSIFGLIDRDVPRYYFEYILLSMTFIRALSQVDKRRGLEGALLFPAIIYLLFILIVKIVSTYIAIASDRPWLMEYFYTIPILHLHTGMGLGSLILFVAGVGVYFYRVFILQTSFENEQHTEERSWYSYFSEHFAEILLWLVACFVLAVLTVFVASDVASKI